MKSFLYFSSLVLFISSALAEDKFYSDKKEYLTLCQIKDGKATGSVKNLSNQGMTYNGDIAFNFYDKDDQLIDHQIKQDFGIADFQAMTKVDEATIPDGSVRCVIDMSSAISDKMMKDITENKETQSKPNVIIVQPNNPPITNRNPPIVIRNQSSTKTESTKSDKNCRSSTNGKTSNGECLPSTPTPKKN